MLSDAFQFKPNLRSHKATKNLISLIHIFINHFYFSFYKPSKPQKQSFWAYFWWFFKDYSPKWGPVCTKFLPVMHCRVRHRIYHVFGVVWKFIKMKLKNSFSGSFSEIFRLHPLTSYESRLNLLPNWKSHKDT